MATLNPRVTDRQGFDDFDPNKLKQGEWATFVQNRHKQFMVHNTRRSAMSAIGGWTSSPRKLYIRRFGRWDLMVSMHPDDAKVCDLCGVHKDSFDRSHYWNVPRHYIVKKNGRYDGPPFSVTVLCGECDRKWNK